MKGTPGRENPGSDRDLILLVEYGKKGATRLGKANTGSRKELLWLPNRWEISEERWRPEGKDAVQVDGCFAPRQDGGVEAVAKKETHGVDK